MLRKKKEPKAKRRILETLLRAMQGTGAEKLVLFERLKVAGAFVNEPATALAKAEEKLPIGTQIAVGCTCTQCCVRSDCRENYGGLAVRHQSRQSGVSAARTEALIGCGAARGPRGIAVADSFARNRTESIRI